METFDYRAAANLHSPKTDGSSRMIGYLGFTRAADAIRYAVEQLSAKEFLATHMDVGSESFDSASIRRLYDDDRYPLSRNSAKNQEPGGG